MEQTRFVPVLLVGLAVIVAGCVASQNPARTQEPIQFETYVFDHGGAGASAIQGGITYAPDTGEHQNYVTLITSRDETTRLNESVLDAGAATFIEDTDFDKEYLIAIQEFPASSAPDYRVEGVERVGEQVRVTINDSSRGGTTDITVETVLVRVTRGDRDLPSGATVTTEDGFTFNTSVGTVRQTVSRPDELPYQSQNESENVDDARSIRIENSDDIAHNISVTVTYTEVPECRTFTPPCGEPSRTVILLNTTYYLEPGEETTVSNVAAKKGTYTIETDVRVETGSGTRTTGTDTFEWRISENHFDAIIHINEQGEVDITQLVG